MLIACTETEAEGKERALEKGQILTMPQGIEARLVDLGLAAFVGEDSSPPYCRKDLNPAPWKKKDEDDGTRSDDSADD